MSQFICGKNSVLEAIKNEIPIEKMYVINNKTKANFSYNFPVIVKSAHDLDKLVKANHQGYVLKLKEFNYYNIDEIFKDKPNKILVLDHIQDPHNFGAIIRTANASGIKHIIIPKNRAVKITPTVLKVASGGQIGIKIIRVDSIYSQLQKMKNNGFWIYCTSIDKNSIDYQKASYNYPMVLIVGNESKGVNKTLLKMSDQNIYIDMKGTVQSLNVSVATGIMLFKI